MVVEREAEGEEEAQPAVLRRGSRRGGGGAREDGKAESQVRLRRRRRGSASIASRARQPRADRHHGDGSARGGGAGLGGLVRYENTEIHRVVNDTPSERPMTHQLTLSAIHSLGSRLLGVDIVDLRANTFYAQLRLTPVGSAGPGGPTGAARPVAR